MRVLHRDEGRSIQGGQIQVRLLVDALRAEGVTCGLIAPWASEPIGAFDLTHCHDSRSHTWAAKPFVVSRRVGFPIGRGWLSRWKYAGPAAFLAISNFVADELKRVGVPLNKIFVVPDAVTALPAADRSSGRVLLLSKNGHEIPGTVPVNHLIDDLRDCDVFVYWSNLEGLGSAALAAQAAGVPVVARRVGGLPEAVRFGFLCDRIEEVPAAVAAARQLTVDRDAIAREFSVSRMARQTIEVYRTALK